MVNTEAAPRLAAEVSPADGDVATAPEPVRVGPPRARPVAVALLALTVVCLTVVFTVVYALGLSAIDEQRSQHELYATFRGLLDPASTVAPSIGGVIPAGTPIAILSAPGAGLHGVVVVEGSTARQLLEGPGHLADSPLPGQAGDAVILGRSTVAGGPFRDVDRLRPGDHLEVRTGQGEFRYVVEDLRSSSAHAPLIPGGGGLLTLVTSAGRGSFGFLEPSRLVYVDARLEQSPVTAPLGRPKTVPVAALPGHGDPGAWPLVGLFSVLLVGGCVATWWLWNRLGILRTWLIAAPVLFALMWGFSESFVRLFPNVY